MNFVQYCESNPFYPAITQADNNLGWYDTDQSSWLGMSDEDSSGLGQYQLADGENYGGVAAHVGGEKAIQ
jgi:hypothetical protein